MRRRWTGWACAGLVLGAVGCNRNSVQNADAGLPQPTGQPSLLSKTFGNHPKFAPPPGAEPVVVRKKSKPGEPLKPETEVALAENDLEAAFLDGRPATERDYFLDSARQRYQRVLDREPNNKAALLGLAKLYAKTGDRDRAMATYQAIQRSNPKDHELAHQMATAQARLGDWAGATESCRYALSIDPENRTYQKTLGFCLAQQGLWDESYTTFLRVMPEADARYFLARMLLDQNREDDGRQQLQLALQAEPNHVGAQSTLAMLVGPAPTSPVPTDGIPNSNGIATVGYTEPAGSR